MSVDVRTFADRVATLDWNAIAARLDDVGVTPTGPVLDESAATCVRDLYDDESRFRKTVDMERHRFGRGEYKYFAAPLPDEVHALRSAFWPHLLPIAREWAARRGRPAPWPDDLDDWLAACHEAGQSRPTPLMLRYEAGDWNALHQDLYGDLVFPLQVVIGLDRPAVDYGGGEFVVVEQRPRAQSRATVSTIPLGHGLIWSTRERPVRSSRGWANAPLRHGVSEVAWGIRRTLGLIFHDAR